LYVHSARLPGDYGQQTNERSQHTGQRALDRSEIVHSTANLGEDQSHGEGGAKMANVANAAAGTPHSL
jgi:hypothetical protein